LKVGVGRGSGVGEQLVRTKAKITAKLKRFIQGCPPEEG